MVDYLPSKKTVIGQYYAEIMFKLYDAISQKRWRETVIKCLASSGQCASSQAVPDCGLGWVE